MCESTIATEVLSGSGLSLAQAARRFPPFRNNKPIAPSTVFRWISSGVRLPGGTRIRLEAVRLGGRYLVSEESIVRFIQAQTPNFDAAPTTLPRTLSQCEKDAECAAKELENLGI